MDPTTRSLMMAAGGISTAPVYIESLFSTWLYTGNGSTQTITNGIDLAGEGGLVWIKGRAAYNNVLVDTVRGAGNRLFSDTTDATNVEPSSVTAFTSSGFTLGNNAAQNASGQEYASWTFRKAPGFFDVVTYTGTGSAQAISHSLGSAPGFIVAKQTNGTSDWIVYHQSRGATKVLTLNSTGAEFTAGHWDSTAPTSTQFYVGGGGVSNNISGGTYVAYLFAHDEQIFGEGGDQSVIKCGSYTGTGAVGNFVDLGWEPQWVLVKKASGGSANNYNWTIVDTMRGAPVQQVNSVCPYLHPNTTGAEVLDYPISPSPTGFIVNNPGGLVNDNGATFIYIAIRRGPMKTPTSGTEVFKADTYTGTITSGNPNNRTLPSTDLWLNSLTIGSNRFTLDRLRGWNYLSTNLTNAEVSWTFNQTDQSTLSPSPDWRSSSVSNIDYYFRRAPGFFDVVAYTGTGVTRTVDHNLGVVPELMIIKNRTGAGNEWVVYASPLGASQYLLLNRDYSKSYFDSGADNTRFWNSTAPTNSVFTVTSNSYVNSGIGTFIAYLFATLPGISKCFSYTGTGTTQQIDCGFTSGARLVLIKRTDSTGDWYIWDTARGITSSTDPYLLINSTAAEVTGTDYIDPYSAGFEISSTAPAAINASGGSFIGLAIA